MSAAPNGSPAGSTHGREWVTLPCVTDHTSDNTPAGLTEIQAKLLDYIRDYVAEHGYPPTVRECMPIKPWSSSSSVNHQLRVLVEKGHITRVAGRPRMIHIVDPAVPTPEGSTRA